LRVGRRGWTEAEWRRREESQLSLDQKRSRANAVIENIGSLDEAADALVTVIGQSCGGVFIEAGGAVGSTA
jgi:dephospho-CoA kinase